LNTTVSWFRTLIPVSSGLDICCRYFSVFYDFIPQFYGQKDLPFFSAIEE
jgi:hypothetical protein